MKILTNDCFFMTGMETILLKMDRECVGVNVIFDSGLDNIYLIKAVAPFRTYNPITAFLKCEKFIVRRDIHDKKFERTLLDQNSSVTKLTKSENIILRLLYRGLSPYRISKILSLSNKTISAYKMRGLRKLGIDNIASFYFTLDMWHQLFSEYISYVQEFVPIHKPDKLLNASIPIEKTRIYNFIN